MWQCLVKYSFQTLVQQQHRILGEGYLCQRQYPIGIQGAPSQLDCQEEINIDCALPILSKDRQFHKCIATVYGKDHQLHTMSCMCQWYHRNKVCSQLHRGSLHFANKYLNAVMWKIFLLP